MRISVAIAPIFLVYNLARVNGFIITTRHPNNAGVLKSRPICQHDGVSSFERTSVVTTCSDNENGLLLDNNDKATKSPFSIWDFWKRQQQQQKILSACVAASIIVTTVLAPCAFHFDGIVFDPSSSCNDPAAIRTPSSCPVVAVGLSKAYALTENQLLVDDVWREVKVQFVDQTFNGLGEDGWSKKRSAALKEVSDVGPDDKDRVYAAIQKMLEALGDPYTRFLTPEQYDTLTAYARGASNSGVVGLQLTGDPASGKIVVMNTVRNGPAERAGILPGDVVLAVDGEPVDGATAEVVAAKCRGEEGTDVTLVLRHGGDGAPEETPSRFTIRRQQLRAETMDVSTFRSDTTGKTVGVIRLASFNQETPSGVMEAMNRLRATTDCCSAVAIDVRGNSGGYMAAGVEVAKQFLPPRARVVSEVAPNGKKTTITNDGVGSDTDVPLFVLVDRRTASASEIMAGALQDNNRAIVVGGASSGQRTFGKALIQNVQALQDGSGVAVTRAKYLTPKDRDIQGVGIVPDKSSSTCEKKDPASACLSGLV